MHGRAAEVSSTGRFLQVRFCCTYLLSETAESWYHRYYTREKEAPILTVVIGGNHEASNYMWELYVDFARVLDQGSTDE